jgi:hypothetical protein
MLIAALLALLAAPARAQEPPPYPDTGSVPPPPGSADPAAWLDSAVADYLAGRPAEARAGLQRVIAVGPALPAEVRRRAMAYLGDLLFSEEGPDASRSVFEALLREDPAFRLDPYEHPVEVCRYVETLRVTTPPTRAQRPDAPVPPAPAAPVPFPSLALVPGGAVYFLDGRPAAGVLVAATQTVTVTTSVVTFALLADAYRRVQEDDAGDEARFNALYVGNRVATVAAWSALVIPPLVETARWGRLRAVQLRATPGGAEVTGRF